MNKQNENGYAIYPACIEKFDIQAAMDIAREVSERDGEARVEDKDTEKVIARFRNGVEVSA